MLQVVLQVKNSNANLKELTIDETTVIGRGSDCGIRVASVEVSRKHCKIEVHKDKATITDLGSSNGTFLNSQKLTPKLAKLLVSSAIIQIGPLEATVVIRKVKEENKSVPTPQKQQVIQEIPAKKPGETDVTVALDPMSAKRAEKKRVDDTLPMVPDMQNLYEEALEYEEQQEQQVPKVERHVVQSTPVIEQTIELELVDDDIVQDSSPGIDMIIESHGSDVILLEETSSMVPIEDDVDQEIADFLKNLKDEK